MFHRNAHRPPWVWILAAFVLISPLSASTVYWDSADWEANTSSFNTIDFEDVAAGSYADATGVVTGSPSVQFVGLSGRTPPNQLWVIDPASDPTYDFGTGQVLKGPMYDGTDGGYLQVNLPSDITSVAFELMTVGGAPGEFAFALSTGDQWTDITVQNDGSSTFIGVTSDVAIAYLQITLTGGAAWDSYPVFDNFSYGFN